MTAGMLDRRIVIQEKTESQDGPFVAKTFATMLTLWSYRNNMNGRDGERYRADYPEAEAVFTIRFNADTSAINQHNRIVDGSQTFDILSAVAKPGGRPEWLELAAKQTRVDNA